ncbi:MAG: hypothetical protein PUK79_05760 [Clostridiales bacterium]|nr:hypothetical protein [Clostridiales bacterium]MDY2836058.1 hypothetical protein [Candidatus Aphodomonas sp.]
MKRRWKRAFSGALAVLALCARFGCACAAPPAVSSFSFERSGSSAGQARSYSIRETARGRFAWIELYYAYHIVLPVSDEEMEALSALIAALSFPAGTALTKRIPARWTANAFRSAPRSRTAARSRPAARTVSLQITRKRPRASKRSSTH